MITRTFSLLFVLISTFYTPSGFTNQGFYQGAGANLYPIENSSMRVITEKLEISPLQKPGCYRIDIPKSEYDEKGEIKDEASGLVGNSIKCPQGSDDLSDVLRVRWHAKAIYDVEALSDQAAVQIGFPVPTWAKGEINSLGLVHAIVPGVANFSTSIDGKKIKDISVKKVLIKLETWARKERLIPAFVWKSDFKKGKRYQLITEYDFGVSYQNGMYERHDYPKESLLWFDRRSLAEVKFGIEIPFHIQSIHYYLHPIRLWGGGAPESISVRVVAPDSMPIYYLIPVTSGIDCVDRHALYFRWNKSFPVEDLKISYPVSNFFSEPSGSFVYAPITKLFEYAAWSELISKLSNFKSSPRRFATVKMDCQLEKEFLRNLPNTGEALWIRDSLQPCVERCDF